jgi:hypothetical protein
VVLQNSSKKRIQKNKNRKNRSFEEKNTREKDDFE